MEDLAHIFFMIAGVFIILKLTIVLIDRLQRSDSEEKKIPAPSPWVMEKVKKARLDANNYTECLRTGICPLCGAGLKEKVYGTYDQFSDHQCIKCGFTSICEVLY